MAFEPAPLLIGLREGLEALLVLGIVLGMLDRMQARDRRGWVWLGFGAGIVVSVIAGIVVQRAIGDRFEAGGAQWFELVVALAAVAVLTYMVLWMQRNARHMVAGVRSKVEQAVTQRQVWVLAFLGFITVVREGLEVVLFFSALSQSIAWADLALWGTVGFAISGVLAFAVFRLTVQVDLRRFFAVTGMLLIFIAAGLLVHVVHAASDLGILPHGGPLWDTSGALPDEDHWLGGPLHALIGYEDQPTLLQLVLYSAYLVGIGGWYLAGLRQAGPARGRAVAASMLIVLLFAFAVAGAVTAPAEHEEDEHDLHGSALYDTQPEHLDHNAITAAAAEALEAYEGRIGVFVRSHGEPTHYNASTYESFKQFIRGIWEYTDLPPELLEVDQGTYYIDDAHPFSGEPHVDADLVDAWLGDAEYPAVPTCDPHGLEQAAMLLGEGCYHITPGLGPGMGEGDLFEVFGLSAYRTWLKMDNHSPKTEQTEDHFDWLEKHLQNHFGDRIVVAFAHHIDPKVGEHRSIEGAAQKLADAGVEVILDSYHSSVHSDAMNTCMMRPHAEMALHDAGFDGEIVPVGMAGTHPAWGEAVATYLAHEMDRFGEDEAVSVHLAQHGGTPGSSNPCGPEGSTDQYHANMDAQFAAAKEVIEGHFGDRFTLRHVYGQGADDPDDGESSPMEALEMDRQDGIGRVVVIPYEFWSDSMDNLVPLRESFGLEVDQAPYYDDGHETHLTIDGVHVEIWSAHYSVEEKGTAHLARISEGIAALG